MDAAQQFEMRKIERQGELEKSQLDWAFLYKKQEMLIDHQLQFSRASLAHSKDYGMATTRNLLVLNGGAIIAILGFIANIVSKESTSIAARLKISAFIPALSIYSAGMICATFVAVMGYWNFMHATNRWDIEAFKIMHPSYQTEDLNAKESEMIMHRTYLLAILFSFLSLALFFVGTAVIGSALSNLG